MDAVRVRDMAVVAARSIQQIELCIVDHRVLAGCSSEPDRRSQ